MIIPSPVSLHATLLHFTSSVSSSSSSSSWIASHTFLAASPLQDLTATTSISSFGAFATSFIQAAPETLDKVQKFGEDAFAAAFAIAFIQAAVALSQYRNNPSGQLVVPPGLTYGVEKPGDTIPLKEVSEANQNDLSEEESSWFSALKDLEATFDIDDDDTGPTTTSDKQNNRYYAIVQRINRSLILLLPWASNVLRFLVQRNIHLFHLGFIFSLAQVMDFPNRLFSMTETEARVCNRTMDDAPPKLPERIVVLGDSLAVGLGTVNTFDSNKRQGRYRAENLEKDDGPGPVFPRVLARTLAAGTGKPVHWRSAGVDGGDTKSIEEHCLGVIQEEVAKGQPPDIVVLIAGINDLKFFAANPFKNAGPQEFRSRLANLISEILELSPCTKIVLPALPTQMFRQDSPLNIFPLVFFLNSIVGFWDSQKKLVADRFPGSNVMYVGISPEEIYDWYMTDTSEYGVEADHDADGVDDMSLISADGVHPNARCYAHWAASIGDKLLSSMPENEVSDGGDEASATRKMKPLLSTFAQV